MLGGMQDWLHILPWSRTEQRDQCEKPFLGSTLLILGKLIENNPFASIHLLAIS